WDYRSRFFFQAEDGIRDRNVTGVQTCALPIWYEPGEGKCRNRGAGLDKGELVGYNVLSQSVQYSTKEGRGGDHHQFQHRQADLRSEERRVGKECRARQARWHQRRRQ